MTKFFICSLILIAMIKLAIYSGIDSRSFAKSITAMNDHASSAGTNSDKPVKGLPSNMENEGNSEKGNGHSSSMDETPHIHHFHKDRVRKIKKHQGKCWLLSQLLLLICHLAILYLGYLHLLH